MASVISDELNAVCVQALDDIWLDAFVRNHPFLDRMTLKKAGGSGYRIPVQTGAGGGAASNFADSLGNSAQNGYTGVGFVIPPAITYGTTRIQWQDQALSETPESPVDIAMNATKNALNVGVENLANMLLGSSSGAAGSYAVISTATNTTGNIWRLVLTVNTDAAKFAQGQTVISKATSTSALDTGSGTVTGVNQVGGSILIDVGSTGMTPTATHIIGLEGQLPAGSDETGLFPSVQQWIPSYANRSNGVPSTSTFLSVTRSEASNVAMVSGWAFNGTAIPKFQAIYQASAYMQNTSKLAKVDTVFCNPLILPALAAECDQKVRYDMASTKGVDVGFAGFEVVLPTGKAEVLAEPSMPVTSVLLSKAGSWVFAKPASGEIFQPATNGKLIIDDYGTGSTPQNQSRASVMAIGFFGCEEPSSQCMLTVGTPTGLALS